jgi:uncharacterized tellurite resistance protein B-like protein
MKIDELTAGEALALLGLLREVVQADDVFSDAERASVAEIAAALGKARFDETAALAQRRFATRAALKEHAKTITRKEARVLIHATLVKVAESDGTAPPEEAPLRWLASWWDLDG